MIAVTLMGGLGNQMFQYAAGRSLALRHRVELVLDVSFLEHPPPNLVTSRRYELGCFNVQARLARRIRSWEEPPSGLGRRGRLVSRTRRAFATLTVVRQKGIDFCPEYFSAQDNTHLVGFWQSQTYFRAHAELIRADFEFSTAPTGRDVDLLARIEGSSSVSLHVRRGDYVSNPAAGAFHGVLSLDYYKRALAEIARRVGDVHVFVFSDDPTYCKKHLMLDLPTTVVDHGGRPASEDLRLMSACKHHIVANSSFSWWGAWLDPREDTVVVSPKLWVRDEATDTSHIVPDGWIRI